MSVRLSRRKKKLLRKQLSIWWDPGPRSKPFWARIWKLLADVREYRQRLDPLRYLEALPRQYPDVEFRLFGLMSHGPPPGANIAYRDGV